MAGTVTVTVSQVEAGQGDKSQRIKKVSVAWVADAADGSVPVTSIDLSGWLVKAVTVPGSTAPTDNYDIILTDPDSATLDAIAGALVDRDTTTPEQVYPVASSAQSPVLLSGSYGFKLTGNSVNSATGSCILYLKEII